jgi:outer membrane beta-barrel protein
LKYFISAILILSGVSALAQSNDKIDLKQIEDQFWAAKDTDFSVVQNRTFPKEKRFFLNLSGGTLINDPFTTGKVTRIGVGYFLSERWGLEIAEETIEASDNKATQNFKQNSLYPNYNKLKSYQSASVTWVPFYAKMSFLDRKILYFDMQLSVGVGKRGYQSFLKSGQQSTQYSDGFHLDVTQNIFFSRHFAFRVDLKNQWAEQNLYISDTGAFKSRERVNDTSLLFGFNIFY